MKTRLEVAFAVAALFFASSASAHPFYYVTHDQGEVDYWPRWSPDGKTILFSRCDISTGCGGGATTGTWNLFTVASSGGKATEFLSITDVSATRSNWLWTSDASITTPIAFTGVHASDEGLTGIYVVGTDGNAPTRLPTADSIPSGYPSWLPDGSGVAVEGQPAGFTGPFIDLVGVP